MMSLIKLLFVILPPKDTASYIWISVSLLIGFLLISLLIFLFGKSCDVIDYDVIIPGIRDVLSVRRNNDFEHDVVNSQ